MIYPSPFGLFKPLSDLCLSAAMVFDTEALQAAERCSHAVCGGHRQTLQSHVGNVQLRLHFSEVWSWKTILSSKHTDPQTPPSDKGNIRRELGHTHTRSCIHTYVHRHQGLLRTTGTQAKNQFKQIDYESLQSKRQTGRTEERELPLLASMMSLLS